jgi:hypothetical protein
MKTPRNGTGNARKIPLRTMFGITCRGVRRSIKDEE